MKPIKESARSTAEEQRTKATCDHEWQPCEGYLFDNPRNVVQSRCSKCGTYKREAP